MQTYTNKCSGKNKYTPEKESFKMVMTEKKLYLAITFFKGHKRIDEGFFHSIIRVLSEEELKNFWENCQ